jgi:hypothetical protein
MYGRQWVEAERSKFNLDKCYCPLNVDIAVTQAGKDRSSVRNSLSNNKLYIL